VFIKCSHRTTLRVIALDKVHVHVQHGTSFHSEIRALQVLFFSKIFREQLPTVRPRLIVLTAAMPTSYLPHLCRLLTVSSFQGESIVRGSPRDFDQRDIEMQTYICSAKGLYVSKGLTLVSEFLRDHTAKSAVIFCFWSIGVCAARKYKKCSVGLAERNGNGAFLKTQRHKNISVIKAQIYVFLTLFLTLICMSVIKHKFAERPPHVLQIYVRT
jgi:hypothetical protein